jgi:hypothetical protein
MPRPDIAILHLQVASLLGKVPQQEAKVNYQDAMIEIIISREDFENRFGALKTWEC